MRTHPLLLFIGLLASACVNRTSVSDTERQLPPGAIAVEYTQGHLFLEGILCDSLPARLVFDTGGDFYYADSLWLTRSGYSPCEVSTDIMPGGQGAKPVVFQLIHDTLPLRIGADTLRMPMTPVLDLKRILGRGVDGIVGQGPMAGRCLEVDYHKGYMRYVSADTLETAGYTRLPFRMTDNRIFVPMRVRIDSVRMLEGDFMLDLGNATAIVLTMPSARRLDLQHYPRRKVSLCNISGGVGGASETIVLRADSVCIAGFGFPGMVIDASQNRSGYLASDHVAGLLGNELLDRFSLVIDYPGSALYLKPNEHFGRPSQWTTYGFSAIDRTDIGDGWVVTALCEDYAPDGLQLADTVVRWNGGPVTGLAIAETMTDPGEDARIGVLRGGATVELDAKTQKLF